MKNLIKYINEWKFDKDSNVEQRRIESFVDHIKIECYDRIYNGDYNRSMHDTIVDTLKSFDQESVDNIERIICAVTKTNGYKNVYYEVNIKINNVDYFIKYEKSSVQHSTRLNFKNSNIDGIIKLRVSLFEDSPQDLFYGPIILILNAVNNNENNKVTKTMNDFIKTHRMKK